MRVSVVIPVLDDAAELAGCLAALAAQTRPPDEVVVVDNGCRDASASIAREEFRHFSYITDVADAAIVGHGVRGYC
ncbi:MAG TPA: glycosyltransferase, partial [Actinomycetales bacterium]|nr:glycosyltransferase [Actinomycetales bacterium]